MSNYYTQEQVNSIGVTIGNKIRMQGDELIQYVQEELGKLEPSEGGGTGIDGQSAYEIAVSAGFEGTQEDWLASLKGEKGNTGTKGAKGDTGEDGKSAYQVAVDQGFVGTESEWLASLKGEKGDAGTGGGSGVAMSLDDGREIKTKLFEGFLGTGNFAQFVTPTDITAERVIGMQTLININGLLREALHSDGNYQTTISGGNIYVQPMASMNGYSSAPVTVLITYLADEVL